MKAATGCAKAAIDASVQRLLLAVQRLLQAVQRLLLARTASSKLRQFLLLMQRNVDVILLFYISQLFSKLAGP